MVQKMQLVFRICPGVMIHIWMDSSLLALDKRSLTVGQTYYYRHPVPLFNSLGGSIEATCDYMEKHPALVLELSKVNWAPIFYRWRNASLTPLPKQLRLLEQSPFSRYGVHRHH